MEGVSEGGGSAPVGTNTVNLAPTLIRRGKSVRSAAAGSSAAVVDGSSASMTRGDAGGGGGGRGDGSGEGGARSRSDTVTPTEGERGHSVPPGEMAPASPSPVSIRDVSISAVGGGVRETDIYAQTARRPSVEGPTSPATLLLRAREADGAGASGGDVVNTGSGTRSHASSVASGGSGDGWESGGDRFIPRKLPAATGAASGRATQPSSAVGGGGDGGAAHTTAKTSATASPPPTRNAATAAALGVAMSSPASPSAPFTPARAAGVSTPASTTVAGAGAGRSEGGASGDGMVAFSLATIPTSGADGVPLVLGSGTSAAELLISPPSFHGHDPHARLPLPKKRGKYLSGLSSALKSLRATVSKKKKRFTDDDFDLDLTYITPRIIAMGFPSSGREGFYRNPLPEVQRFFETRHPGRYRIYNLCSERGYDPADFLGRVCRFPFDDHNPSPLELVPQFCADVDSWLNEHPDNVVAVHCKAGKGRTGQMVAAYLLHCGLRPTAEAALKWFGMKRTANGQGVTIPSQMRYVHYYEQMLRHGTPPVSIYRIQWIRVKTVPNSEMGGGCTPYFDVRVNGERVFDYKKAVGKRLRRYKRGEPYIDFDLTRMDVRIQGNVKLQLYHDGLTSTTKLAHLWFHTGFVSRNYLAFTRNVIDKANKDKRGVFATNFGVEVYLTRMPAEALAEDLMAVAVMTTRAAAAAPLLAGGGGHPLSPAMAGMALLSTSPRGSSGPGSGPGSGSRPKSTLAVLSETLLGATRSSPTRRASQAVGAEGEGEEGGEGGASALRPPLSPTARRASRKSLMSMAMPPSMRSIVTGGGGSSSSDSGGGSGGGAGGMLTSLSLMGRRGGEVMTSTPGGQRHGWQGR